QGDFEVLEVGAVDETTQTVYFTCNKDDARQHQVYSIKLDGSDLRKISKENGAHKVDFANDAKHYVDMWSATLTPPQMSICSTDGTCRAFWDSHPVGDFALTQPKFLQFTADDGTTLYGSLILPPEEATNGKIPLIVNIYGGQAL